MLCAMSRVSHGISSCGHGRPERSTGVQATENVTAVPGGVIQPRPSRPLPWLWKPVTTASRPFPRPWSPARGATRSDNQVFVEPTVSTTVTDR